MICLVKSRISKNKYRAMDTASGRFVIVNSSILSPSVGDYVIVTDNCITSKTTYQTSKDVYRV